MCPQFLNAPWHLSFSGERTIEDEGDESRLPKVDAKTNIDTAPEDANLRAKQRMLFVEERKNKDGGGRAREGMEERREKRDRLFVAVGWNGS